MSYVVTARKWRPMVFEDVVGQSHVTTTLRNAIATNRLSHAYIFSGPRGCGKTTTARILAKAINCLQPKEFNPDNACDLCTEITEGRSVNVFEIDGASNRGIEEIRSLREAVRYAPAKGKYKIYIIDEVHMLTKEAFNALLKTLEEPPPHVLFIFATTEVHKVPLTILSRCQRFDFRRISIDEIVGRLQFIAEHEKIAIDHDALLLIAKKGDGSMRDAQSIFDQIISFCGTSISHQQIVETLNLVDEEMYFRVTDLIAKKDSNGALTLVEEIMSRGYDLREFLGGLNEHFRNMLVVLSTGSTHLVELSEAYKKRYQEIAPSFSELDILRFIKITSDTDAALRWTQQPRYKLEVALLQMIKMEGSIHIEQLLSQLDDIKKKLNGGAGEKRKPAYASQVEPAAEAPIRGSVKASHPTLKPDQIVSSHKISFEASSFTTRVSEPKSSVSASLPSADVALVPISIEEAAKKWPSLIEETRKQRVILGTMLSESSLVEMADNRLRVACPDNFHLDELKRNREFLSQLAEKVYGSRIRLEAILSDKKSFSSQPKPAESTPHDNKPARRDNERKHPVIQALIREFGAEEVE